MCFVHHRTRSNHAPFLSIEKPKTLHLQTNPNPHIHTPPASSPPKVIRREKEKMPNLSYLLIPYPILTTLAHSLKTRDLLNLAVTTPHARAHLITSRPAPPPPSPPSKPKPAAPAPAPTPGVSARAAGARPARFARSPPSLRSESVVDRETNVW